MNKVGREKESQKQTPNPNRGREGRVEGGWTGVTGKKGRGGREGNNTFSYQITTIAGQSPKLSVSHDIPAVGSMKKLAGKHSDHLMVITSQILKHSGAAFLKHGNDGGGYTLHICTHSPARCALVQATFCIATDVLEASSHSKHKASSVRKDRKQQGVHTSLQNCGTTCSNFIDKIAEPPFLCRGWKETGDDTSEIIK